MFDVNAALVIGVTAAVTIGLRFLPFLIFGKRETPAFITYFGKVLPCAIMGMMVIYCLRSTDFASTSHGIPELAASLLTVLLHAWKRNTLVSIIGGTVCYMLLVQFVF